MLASLWVSGWEAPPIPVTPASHVHSNGNCEAVATLPCDKLPAGGALCTALVPFGNFEAKTDLVQSAAAVQCSDMVYHVMGKVG